MAQRPIKFRFWDTDAKEWVAPSEIEFKYDGTDNANIGIPFSLYQKNIIYQQFTGYKDIKGKEIYEGDIVEQNHVFVENGIVEFIGGAFMFVTLDKLQCNSLIVSRSGPIPTTVIGNIFENKELIK